MRIVRVAGFNGLLRDEITLPLLCDLRQRSKLVNLSLFRQGTHAQGNAGDAGRIEAGLGGTSATRRFTNGHGPSLSTMPDEALDWNRCTAPRRNVSGMRVVHVGGT